MVFFLFHICTLLSVAVAGSHAVTPEAYWKSVLPNSPMPKSIKDLLYTEWNEKKTTAMGIGKGGVNVPIAIIRNTEYGTGNTGYGTDNHKYGSENKLKDNPNGAWYFLENDLHQGTEMSLNFTKNHQKAKFLPRKIADSIPFSSKKLPQIYNKFSVKPDSIEAEIMKQTLNDCERTGIEGEEKYCTTSLESMVDFSTTKLGKNVRAISTEVNVKENTRLQKYKIEGVKMLASNKVVVCHKQNYAYAVYYCHKFVGTRAYVVSMVGVDGTKVNADAICHTDNAKWNPKHLAFQALKVKPGTVSICHFLPNAHVVWVPY